MTHDLPKFATVKELSQLYPFSESSLRSLIFNANQNGLNSCIRKIGKKIVINVSEFEAWLNSHRADENKNS